MADNGIRAMSKKVCLIGDSKVGKTSLLERYINDDFLDKYIATISAKIFKKELEVSIPNNGNTNVINMTLSIWDLIGHRDREYWSLLKRYYLNTDGVLFVCDLTVKTTLENLRTWVVSLFNTIGVIPFVIMANKSDLIEEAQFTQENLTKFANQYNSDFYFTSAKTGSNVINSFKRLGELMAERAIRIENIQTPKDVLKQIIDDYCILHGGQDRAMPIINHQFKQAGANMESPTKQSLLLVIDRLTQVTMSFKGREVAKEERTKYLRLVHKLT